MVPAKNQDFCSCRASAVPVRNGGDRDPEIGIGVAKQLEEAAALEETEDAALEDGRKGAGVDGGEVGRLVEAVEEEDGAELGVGTGAGTVVPQPDADGAEQDPEHGAG